MDILFVIGLPRSGTTLVHQKIHEETGRKAIYLKDLDLEVPHHLKDFHKDTYLAEIHDLKDYVEYFKNKEGEWVVKSVELNQIPSYMEVFPEASFLFTVRPAGEIMSSVMEYFRMTGLRWPYNPEEAVKQLVRIATARPEKFRYVEVTELPEWKSDREATKTFTTLNIDHYYKTLKGVIQPYSWQGPSQNARGNESVNFESLGRTNPRSRKENKNTKDS